MSKYANSKTFELVEMQLQMFGLSENRRYFESAQDLIMLILERPFLREKTLYQMSSVLAREMDVDVKGVYDRIRHAVSKAKWTDDFLNHASHILDIDRYFFLYVADTVLEKL